MLSYSECYHGTSYDNYKSIKNDRQFKSKNRKNHWLGQGVYFFIEDREKAIWFVNASKSPALKGKRKCVIKISVEIEKDKFLNLDTEHGRNSLEEFARALKREGVLLHLGSDRDPSSSELRCFLIDMYNGYYDIQAVKYTFTDDKISYENINTNAKSYDRIQNNGIQLNIVDQTIINFDELDVQCI